MRNERFYTPDSAFPEFPDDTIAIALYEAASSHGNVVESTKAPWLCEVVGTVVSVDLSNFGPRELADLLEQQFDCGSAIVLYTTLSKSGTTRHYVEGRGDWGSRIWFDGPFDESLPGLDVFMDEDEVLILDDDYWVSCTTGWPDVLISYGWGWERSETPRPKCLDYQGREIGITGAS